MALLLLPHIGLPFNSTFRFFERKHIETKGFQMIFYAHERMALFIDGANLYSAARGLNFDIDYKRLLDYFRAKGTLIRAFYYTALLEDQEYSPLRPLIDWLDYNGYSVVTKPAKEFTGADGRRRVKGNMDIELAIDALELADKIDHFILFSGDGDFRRLVDADELRRQADQFIELETLRDAVGRAQTERPAPAMRNDIDYEYDDDDEGLDRPARG